MLLINRDEVRRLLTMERCMELVASALRTLAQGRGVNPLRPIVWHPDRKGALGLMPAVLLEPPVMGVKVISVFPGNHGTPFDSHQGVVLLFECENGRLIAQADGGEVTAIRTAAASGVATRLLARPESEVVAILGSGVQARTHLEAMRAVRSIREVRVWSRNQEHATIFAEEQSSRVPVPIRPVSSAKDAVSGADIVCTTTGAMEPILKGEWLSPGTHINAVGACIPKARELDTETVRRARVFVDRIESALNEAGDFLIPKAEGAIGDDHLQGEIGELLLSRIEGRRTAEEITIFKSLGIGAEDAVCVEDLARRAREEGLGIEVDLDGSGDLEGAKGGL